MGKATWTAIARTRKGVGDDLVDNILSTLVCATPHEHESGMAWYSVAHDIAAEITDGDVTTGAGIIAALSPQVGWVPNIAAARDLVTEEADPMRHGVLGKNVDKGWAILNGASPSTVLGGNKVRSFYRNILLPHRAGAVTIDRHALNIALLGPGETGGNHRVLARRGGYCLIAAAYRSAAREIGVLPHQLQAVTWLCHRRLLDESTAAAGGNLAKAHIAQRSNLS